MVYRIVPSAIDSSVHCSSTSSGWLMRAALCLWSEHDYEVAQLDEIPTVETTKLMYFPANAKAGFGDALLLRCMPTSGEPWIGVFAREHSSGLLALYSCPSRTHFLVVAGGRGYLCNAEDPRRSSEVPCYPIAGVHVAAEAGLLLLNDFTTVTALGRDGVAWKTGRISWDGITFDRVDAMEAEGRASDPTGPARRFVIDLGTGGYQGGSGPAGL